MDMNEHIQNMAATNVMGNNNTIHNTLNVTVNLDSSGGTRGTDSGTQTSSASGGASHPASHNNSTQTNRAPGGASHPASYNINNIAESITDEAKRNAVVKEIEITWLAKEVSKNGLFCSKKDSLYRHLNIPDQECVRIKHERLVGNRNIEDEIFKVINLGWLQQPPTKKTRNLLIKQLFTFNKSLAKTYAEYINSCNNFDIGLPLPLLPPPGTMTTCSSLPIFPSIEGLSSLPSLLSPTEIPTLAFSSLAIEGSSSVEEGQLVPASTHPIHQGSSSVDGGEAIQSSTFPIHLRADVSENEISWVSEKVANGRHSSERNSLYRHLNIPNSEVEKIKYEKLGEDRNIENEIFKVLLHGWYLQGLSRMRALFYWQLLTFDSSLAEDYLKFLNDQVEDISSGH